MDEASENIPAGTEKIVTPVVRRALAMLGTILPLSFGLWAVRRHISPELAATLAVDMPVSKASAMIDRLPTEYLVETLQWIDPVGVKSLLLAISPETAARISKCLADSREFTEMSALVAFLSPEAMVASVRVLHSGHDLLNVASHVTEKELLSPAILSIPIKKLPGLFSAADSAGKWREIFDIVEAMDSSTQKALGEKLSWLGSQDVTSFLRASLRLNTWAQLLSICLSLPEISQSRLAALIADQDESLHLGFMRSAKDQAKMQLLLKLVSCMPMSDQRRLVRLAGRNGIRITSVL